MSTMPHGSDDDDLRRRREAKKREAEERESWAEFRAEIDRRLDNLRPERAGKGEYDWREPVYGWARNHMPDEANIVRNTAKREVDRREVEATKAGNQMLRAWMNGVMPLSWDLLGPKPIVVGRVRVRFNAATPGDVETAARELLAAGTKVFAEVQQLVQGQLDLGRAARTKGLDYVAELGKLAPRSDDEPENFWEVQFDELDWDDQPDDED